MYWLSCGILVMLCYANFTFAKIYRQRTHQVSGELNNNELKETFNILLNSLTSVNKDRLDAIQKLYELESYKPKVVRASDDEPMVAIIITDKYHSEPKYKVDANILYNNGPSLAPSGTPESIVMKAIDEASLDDIEYFDTINEQEEFDIKENLREWKGCNKSAAKACRKACYRAFKDVCSGYKCSRSMKKTSKKTCKKSCLTQFKVD